MESVTSQRTIHSGDYYARLTMIHVEEKSVEKRIAHRDRATLCWTRDWAGSSRCVGLWSTGSRALDPSWVVGVAIQAIPVGMTAEERIGRPYRVLMFDDLPLALLLTSNNTLVKREIRGDVGAECLGIQANSILSNESTT